MRRLIPLAWRPISLAARSHSTRAAALLLGLVLTIPPPWRDAWAQRASSCKLALGPWNSPVRISDDSVGLLPVGAQMGELRRMCPDARDTSVSIAPQASGEAPFPGLVIRYGDSTILALQYQDRGLRPDLPPDGWIVAGTNAVLPSGVPLGAKWAAIWSQYGAAQASGRGVLVVRFCSLPRTLFTLNVDPSAVVSSGRVDLALIPDDATIHHIFIIGHGLARSFGPCP